MAEGKPDAEVKLILYHWTHSFSSQKVQASAAQGRADRVSAPGQLPLAVAGPRRPTQKPASRVLIQRARAPGQGRALVDGGRIRLRCKGSDSDTANHDKQ